MSQDLLDRDLELDDIFPGEDEEPPEPEQPQLTQAFVDDLVSRTMVFVEVLLGYELFPYQRRPAMRIIEAVLLGKTQEITLLQARQSGKTETVGAVMAGLMIVMPILAKAFPDLYGKYKNGLWIGVFGPVEEQAETIFERIVSRLTSDRALEILGDPEIDDRPAAGGKIVRLKNSGSFCRMQTANPKAKIESKSYHIVVIDEAQDADDTVVRKSIHPMLAFYNGIIVKTGTPTTHKGDFYRAIIKNKREGTKRGARQNHFEADWRECARYNRDYGDFVKEEMVRLGPDSDDFRMSYALEWLLDQGMFVPVGLLNFNSPEFLGDKQMPIVRAYHEMPVLMGVDPARERDSTVVTIVWVNWEWEDATNGLREHRILNWLEIPGGSKKWEEQYYMIRDFARNYRVLSVAVDAQGMGSAVAERLALMMPYADVHPLSSTRPEQSKRWKHLAKLLNHRRADGKPMLSWPADPSARRTRVYRRFIQQMEDLEKLYVGDYMLAEAPEEADAHDDFPDSLALACVLTEEAAMPTVEVSQSPFNTHRRRRR